MSLVRAMHADDDKMKSCGKTESGHIQLMSCGRTAKHACRDYYGHRSTRIHAKFPCMCYNISILIVLIHCVLQKSCLGILSRICRGL